MRVLIAGHSLSDVGGVQTYERDLASWLMANGHSVVVYATVLGQAASQFSARTIPVTDDLRTISGPIDVIHGDAAIETMIALLHFPDAQAVFVCHGWESRSRVTPRFPRIVRYVAVDDTCADRLLSREGIPSERVSVILNSVDVDAFRQREPLPTQPKRAIVFSNTAHELTFLPAVRDACRRASIDVDVVGSWSDAPAMRPETILGDYDIAFAKAKCALEAMACGLAVILCDTAGLGGMVHSSELDRLRRLNFGIRSLRYPVSAKTLGAEIARYDPDDARLVSNRIRATAASSDMHTSLLSIYEKIIAERASTDRVAESRAASLFLRDLAKAEQERIGSATTLVKASHRMLQIPILGPLARRVLSRFVRRSLGEA